MSESDKERKSDLEEQQNGNVIGLYRSFTLRLFRSLYLLSFQRLDNG